MTTAVCRDCSLLLVLISSLLNQEVLCEKPIIFDEVGSIETRGAAGIEYIHCAKTENEYISVSNFFSSSSGSSSNPERRASTKTNSEVLQIWFSEEKFVANAVLSIPTDGAHGVEASDEGFLAIPNFYGEDTLIYRADDDGQYQEFQRVQGKGAAAVEFFSYQSKTHLVIAEYFASSVGVYELDDNEKEWKLQQRLNVAGPAALSIAKLSETEILLLVASYNSQEYGWYAPSEVYLNRGDGFQLHQKINTVGAHDVETVSVDGRLFAFFANDKNEKTTKIDSELLEWIDGAFLSKQKVLTDGAHGATWFQFGGHTYLAVANFGDRQTGDVVRDSAVFQLLPGSGTLDVVQKLRTFGATDFESFQVRSGETFLAVANEQHPDHGGDTNSTVWQIRQGDQTDEL